MNVLHNKVYWKRSKQCGFTVDAESVDLALVSDDEVGGVTLQPLDQGVIACFGQTRTHQYITSTTPA